MLNATVTQTIKTATHPCALLPCLPISAPLSLLNTVVEPAPSSPVFAARKCGNKCYNIAAVTHSKQEIVPPINRHTYLLEIAVSHRKQKPSQNLTATRMAFCAHPQKSFPAARQAALSSTSPVSSTSFTSFACLTSSTPPIPAYNRFANQIDARQPQSEPSASIQMKTPQSVDNRERVLLVGVGLKKSPRGRAGDPAAAGRDSLEELQELAVSAGANIAGTLLQIRETLDPATLVGRGKIDEIRMEAELHRVPLVIVDHNLSPVQLRNMEKGIGRRVIDRTQLILDIFATHARTREGQLQVELAQLNYLLPRLTGRGEELSRLGGGIGTRGPGEQKLETDRRRIRDRVSKIKQSIETVRRQRTTRRRARQAVPLGMIALVGYTNAGKSTLFNALTHAEVLTSSKMFATLDPTIRAVRLPSRRRVLISDTVGFLRDLPPDLIAAFRATLEEVQEAALLLHVTDISNPHHAEQDVEVVKVLADLGVDDRPRLHVFNKIDRLGEEDVAALKNAKSNLHPRVFTSAETGEGIGELLARIDEVMPGDPLVHVQLKIPVSDGRHLSLVHACGRVLHSEIQDAFFHLDAELPESLARRLEDFAVSPAPADSQEGRAES
jgi:GTP-binding protein HflX